MPPPKDWWQRWQRFRWWQHAASNTSNSHYQLATIPPHANVIELSIIQPYSTPAAAINPASPDRRRLGAALLGIRSEAQAPA